MWAASIQNCHFDKCSWNDCISQDIASQFCGVEDIQEEPKFHMEQDTFIEK